MSEPNAKTFDCVQSMRQIRDALSAEIADLGHDDLIRWLRGHHYSDPILQRVAEKAARQAAAADRPSAGR